VKVCLASAPTISGFDELAGVWDRDADSRLVPLGVLTLAAVLERGGFTPEVVNLDEAYAAWIEAGGKRTAFPEHAADQLAQREVDVYGLGTICSSYPTILRIATGLRQRRPSSRIVLGGPQATATDVETLAAFPAIDLVVRGESDATFPELIARMAAGGDWSSVRGICGRAGSTVERTPDAALVEDLDSLPLPAYHLCRCLTRQQSLPLEVGRGCPFSCTFCSTSRYFGRRFRMRSPERIVGDMLLLRRRYGIRRFDLVHDNFTVDRERVLAFCDAITATGLRFTWTCSSRCDSMDEELLDRMWRAGCRGLFFGVESGSPQLQDRIGKRLDLDDARRQLGAVGRRRMPSSVGFITGFPEESPSELRATVEFFVDTLRFDALEPQLSLLSPLPGTPIHQQHRASLLLDEIVSDISFQGVTQDGADRALVASHPEVFSSFYAVPSSSLDRRDLHELRCFLHATRAELRWLLLSAVRVCGGGQETFHAFRSWRRVESRAWPLCELEAYYGGPAFPREFFQFVRQEVARRAGGAEHSLVALADLSADLMRHARRDDSCVSGHRSTRSRGPRLAPGLLLSRIGCDGAALLRCVRRGGDLSRVPRRETGILARRRKHRLEVSHVGDAAAQLLALCDGTRDQRGIARAFAARFPLVAGVPGARACAVGLAAFARKGVVVLPPRDGLRRRVSNATP
jgi:radical SAM superfamily enzyme YgiQ (UPF0313 family)